MAGKQTDIFKLDDAAATDLANCLRAMGDALLHAKTQCEDAYNHGVDRNNWNTDAYGSFGDGPVKSFGDWCWSGYTTLHSIADKIQAHGDVHQQTDRKFGDTTASEY